MKKSYVRVLNPSVLVLSAVLLAACDREQAPQISAVTDVEVVTTAPQTFTRVSELPGRIEPVRVAQVSARVAGIILSRHFEEGADVEAGQLLFQIDPAPFKAELARARGEQAKAEAALAEARSVVKRYEPLVKIDAVSQQDFDAALAAFKSAQADREAAIAAVEIAQLNLGYATVTAPISGRVGRALVTEGALVGQNEATPLAVIQQLDPIYADFKQPVADMLRLRDVSHPDSPNGGSGKAPTITLTLEGTHHKRDGHLLFSDITVDRGTGQIMLRGQFDNADALLLPGMFVRVQIDQGTDHSAIMVPQRAVKRATDGNAHVLVIGPDDVAQARLVVTGEMQGGLWHIVEGLAPGERVVVGGDVEPGAKVSIRTDIASRSTATAASEG